MKYLLLALALSASFTAQATVDAHTRVFILVKNIQSEEYFVEQAPIIGCYGIAKGPQLIQLTASYTVSSNIGCGGPAIKDEINSLICAKVVDSEEANDYTTFKSITLDISKCADKDNADFIAGIKKVVKMNFSTSTVKNPALTILK